MSSATSTEARHTAGPAPERASASSLAPWQFFVLAALGCATAALFASRGQGVTAVVMLTLIMGAAALVGLAVLRMLHPLVFPEQHRTSMIGGRTRAALEREKMLVLRSIKELEFDRAMGKLSDGDWQEMSGRLRARAARLIRELDAGGYRGQIERELAGRLGRLGQTAQPATTPGPSQAARGCASCGTANDADARFCKSCGTPL